MPEDHQNLLVDEIVYPQMLDELWKAYQDTKDLAYAKRVLSVLDWEDGVRAKLKSWLSQLPDSYETTAEYQLFQQRFIDWTMPVDCSKKTIAEPADLDIHVALLAKNRLLKFDELPMELDGRTLVRLAMKQAALWSLKSMADQCPAVAKLCEVEATKIGGAARRHLAKEV